MNANHEALIDEEQQKLRARQQAISRETAGVLSFAKTMRWIGWGCAFVPIIGILGIFLFMLIALGTSIYLQARGNSEGVKQLLFTVMHAAGASLLFFLVNFVGAVALNVMFK